MISVIMPTYNSAATLPRAIDSMLRQTYTDWELIVVDDGSTDDTAEILAGVADARVRVFHHTNNRGYVAAKNTALDHIRGHWFTNLNSDDELVPEALAAILECAERTGATAITCNAVDIVTGQKAGTGLTREGWVSAEDASRSRGDYWGLTKTSLLDGLRFDERVGGVDATLWVPINRRARRYYLDCDLYIYHTEGVDRVSQRKMSMRAKVRMYSALGENRVYLEALRATDPKEFKRTILRVRAARLLRPFYLHGSRAEADSLLE